MVCRPHIYSREGFQPTIKGSIVYRNVRAAPHNSARSLRQDFCSNSKFRKWRNTVCISHFRNCGSGAKRRLRLADAIARCCLNAIPLLEVSESLSRPWDEADEVSSGDFGTGRRLNPKSSSLNRLSENGSLLNFLTLIMDETARLYQ